MRETRCHVLRWDISLKSGEKGATPHRWDSDMRERKETFERIKEEAHSSCPMFRRPVMSNSLRSRGLQASLSHTICWSLPRFLSIASVMLSSHLILWRPLLLLPSIFSSIRDFSNESTVRIRRPKYWNFSFSISPSSEYSGLISFKIDRFDLSITQLNTQL